MKQCLKPCEIRHLWTFLLSIDTVFLMTIVNVISMFCQTRKVEQETFWIETFKLLSNPNGNEGSGFNGMGIYRSTDGETFNALSNTSSFGNVFVLTAHPSTNHIYAGSSNGLRVSEDGGDTWKLIRGGSCRDMKFNKNE